MARPRAIRSSGAFVGIGSELFVHAHDLPEEESVDGTLAAKIHKARSDKLKARIEKEIDGADADELIVKVRRLFATYSAHSAASSMRPSPADEWSDIQATIAEAEQWLADTSDERLARVLNSRILALPGSAEGLLNDAAWSAYAMLKDTGELVTWRRRDRPVVDAVRLLTDGLRTLKHPAPRTKRTDAARNEFAAGVRELLIVESRLCDDDAFADSVRGMTSRLLRNPAWSRMIG